jgi:hypothetical protein
MLTDLLTNTVTLHRRVPGPPDEFGDPTETITDQTVAGLLNVRGSSEDVSDNARRQQLGTVYLNGKVDLSGADACTIEGVRWEFDGDPEWQMNPRTAHIHHTRINVARAYG